MVSIFKRKDGYYYLNEWVDGKSKLTPLGTKCPIPKNIPRTNLPAEMVEHLKRKASQKIIKPIANPVLPDGKYSVILADPPWRYDFDVESRATEKHYPTLTLGQIINYKDSQGIPITDKFADDCILFLWATSPKLNEALEVIKQWGFIYKTNLIWAKDKIGLGWYCRNQHELLLIAEKGEMPLPEPPNRPRSILYAPRTNHSNKPKLIYRLIEKAYPNYEKYLELFGIENKRKRWIVWGNELYTI